MNELDNLYKEANPGAGYPRIDFKATGELLMEGSSIPEDSDEFYMPVLGWLDRYLLGPAELTVLEFKFNYYNTSSIRYVNKILEKMIFLKETNRVKILWYFDEDDEETEETGRELKIINKLDMQIIEIKKKKRR